MTAMNTKILFTDLDGTLLNDNKEITPGNRRAVERALEAGHRIVLSTGRPLPSALLQAEKLGLLREGCYAITYNGAQIYDLYHQKTIYGQTIPMEVVKPLFEAALGMGLHIQTYDEKQILALRDREELRAYSGFTGLSFRLVEDIEEALPSAPYKLIAIHREDRELLEAFQREELSKYSEILDSFFSNDLYLEIVAKNISKGFAVRWLCDFLEIPIENSVAAGDAQNDIPMLEAAAVGAVMRNAFPGIAEHGSYVTEADNNHDGVGEIIEKFLLSQP